MRRKTAILIVDDDANDQFLIQTALRQGGAVAPIFAVNDGAEAIAYLKGEGPYADREFFLFPTMILTDLKMPKVNGFELLRFLQGNSNLSVLPTIVLSSSSDRHDVQSAYRLGANSYQVKSQTLDALCEQMKLIHDYWMRCEVPEADTSGNLLQTDGDGKLSEKALHSGREL
jgi:CheY-like chemotaxis protein